jgi:hypothetical protein
VVFDEILCEAKKLPIYDQFRLAAELWGEPEMMDDVSGDRGDEVVDMLDARDAEMEADSSLGISPEEIMACLRAKWRSPTFGSPRGTRHNGTREHSLLVRAD